MCGFEKLNENIVFTLQVNYSFWFFYLEQKFIVVMIAFYF